MPVLLYRLLGRFKPQVGSRKNVQAQEGRAPGAAEATESQVTAAY